jgi:nucleoside-diphosphate-sugar epimerase
MKIHITGGRGFLAGWMLPLLRQEHEVEISDRDSMDVTDFDAVRRTFAASRPDVVIHLAALCGAKPSRERPPEFFAVNAQGTVNVLEGCRQSGVRRFILASSMTVFGSGDEARDESSLFAPRHPYAVSKVAAEFAALEYTRLCDLKVSVVRPTLVIGEGFKEPHAVGDFTATALRGDDILLFGPGDHRRDFVHPFDVARAFRLAVHRLVNPDAPAYETFNVSSGQHHSMRELADLVIRTLGRGRRVHGPLSEQSFSLYTKIDRARQVLGYEPSITTEDIIRRLAPGLRSDAA